MTFKYDFAISFAGEVREIAEEIANLLMERNAIVFYDRFFEGEMLGKKLSTYFHQRFGIDAKYVIILISKEYPLKDLAYYGIDMYLCKNNNISNNLMNENYRGIIFQGSDYNLISKNNISKNIDRALSLYGGSEENMISHNKISDTEDDGIYLMDGCSNNTIFDNNIENSELNGIVLEDDCDCNNITRNLIEKKYYTLNNL